MVSSGASSVYFLQQLGHLVFPYAVVRKLQSAGSLGFRVSGRDGYGGLVCACKLGSHLCHLSTTGVLLCFSARLDSMLSVICEISEIEHLFRYT